MMRRATVCAEEVDDDEAVKWVTHYASVHDILLVGEGDFSFSHSLASTFGSASNIVATSLDTYEAVIAKYKNAKSILESLKKMGATILHGIDATKMKLHSDLKMQKFDRIVFNFPHAGFKGKEDSVHLINQHKQLVCGFFNNASHMLRPYGEVHVSHKTGVPFCYWNLEELASKNFLALVDEVVFKIQDYPGYHNKRGDGGRCDKPFPLGECSTFKFRICKNTTYLPTLQGNRGDVVISTSFVNTAATLNMPNLNTEWRYLPFNDNNLGRHQPSSFPNANVYGASGSLCSPSARLTTSPDANFGPPLPIPDPVLSSRSIIAGRTYVTRRRMMLFASADDDHHLLQSQDCHSHHVCILRRARMRRILGGSTPSLHGGVGTLYRHADRSLPF